MASLGADSRAHRAAREASGLSQGLPPGVRGDDPSKASRSLCFPRHRWNEYARRQRATSDAEDAMMARWAAVDELADGPDDSGGTPSPARQPFQIRDPDLPGLDDYNQYRRS